MRVLFAAGGTGGHINPALSAAEELRSRVPDAAILFVGTKEKMEANLVPKAGFDFASINISGFYRSFSPTGIAHNLKTLKKLLFALLIWRGVVIGINNPSRYNALVAMGVVFQLGVQVILNILVATDSIPNTGISLPFFSYGGTAIIVTLAQMGFVLSISRDSRIRRD